MLTVSPFRAVVIAVFLACGIAGVSQAWIIQAPAAGGGGSSCGGTGTIAFDAASESTTYLNWSYGSTITWSHTVTGSNRLLLVYPVSYSVMTRT